MRAPQVGASECLEELRTEGKPGVCTSVCSNGPTRFNSSFVLPLGWRRSLPLRRPLMKLVTVVAKQFLTRGFSGSGNHGTTELYVLFF